MDGPYHIPYIYVTTDISIETQNITNLPLGLAGPSFAKARSTSSLTCSASIGTQEIMKSAREGKKESQN